MSFESSGGYVGKKRALDEYPYLTASDFRGLSSQYRWIMIHCLCFPRLGPDHRDGHATCLLQC
jgi:hypothetical protein